MDKEITNTLLYVGDDGAVVIEVIIDSDNETMWANQKTMAELFNVTKQNISYHLNDIFETEELDKNSTVKKILTVQNEGNRQVKREQTFYNLDAIISVGYRVNSKQATHFRRWATSVLKDYMIKGFVLDENLLKNNGRFGIDYFNRLLEKIREIRASERRFNQKLTDIYKTSYDYNSNSEITKEFFATVQNKLIFAVTGQTAAEIIMERSDKNKTNMGLTNWDDSPNGKILQSDVVISKNYLAESELSLLNNLVDGFLTLAETMAMSNQPTFMNQWKELLDDYIRLSQLPKLDNKGKVSSKQAREHAIKEYKEFRKIQDKEYKSDFDQMIIDIKRLEGKNN